MFHRTPRSRGKLTECREGAVVVAPSQLPDVESMDHMDYATVNHVTAERLYAQMLRSKKASR
jgi:hypothetical protein